MVFQEANLEDVVKEVKKCLFCGSLFDCVLFCGSLALNGLMNIILKGCFQNTIYAIEMTILHNCNALSITVLNVCASH